MNLEDLEFNELGWVEELGENSISVHRVAIGTVIHPSGKKQYAVQIEETHEGYNIQRRFALSTLVHLAANVTDAEIWEIGDRSRDYRDKKTPLGIQGD